VHLSLSSQFRQLQFVLRTVGGVYGDGGSGRRGHICVLGASNGLEKGDLAKSV